MGLKERREREKEERRNQILDAARDLLFKKGLNATSINQIAKRAELGVGTIYFYYRSKEELFAVLQQEGIELLQSGITEASGKADSPDEKLREVALAYLRFSEENKDYFDILNYFLASPEEVFTTELKDQVDQRADKILLRVEEIIEQGMNAGVFKPVNARHYAIMLWGTLHGLIQFKKMKNTLLRGEDHERVFRDSVDYLINSLS